MKLLVSKNENNILVKIEKNGVEMNFDYISFVNDLCNGEAIAEITYTENIVEWEKNKINDLVNKIKESATQVEEIVQENNTIDINAAIQEEMNEVALEELAVSCEKAEQ